MKRLNNDNEIRRLLDLFMDGATTCAQEKQLHDYFSTAGDDIPDDIRPYREMVMWLGDGMPDIKQPSKTIETARPRRFSRWWSAVAIAAVVALVVSIDVFLSNHSTGTLTAEDYITYAGSYVIRNGHKETDLDVIMPELKRAEEIAQQQSRQADKATSVNADDAVIKAIDEVIDTSDPDVEAALEAALSDESPIER